MSDLDVGAASRLEMRALIQRFEDGGHIVGSLENGEFVSLPEVGKRAIDLFASGACVGDAEQELAAEYDGGEVDLVDFATQLVDLGFVRSVDGVPVAADEPIASSLPWLQPRHVRGLFSRTAAVVYALIVGAGVTAAIADPRTLPSYHSFFWLHRTSVVLALSAVIWIGLVILHEFSHCIAARSLGIPARFSLGTRLYALAAQTDVRCLWAVSRRDRFRVYLAGMAFDTALLSGSLLTAWLAPPLRPFLGAMALMIVLNIAGQFQLFMKTDVYCIVADLVHAKNLYQDAAAFVLDRLRPLVRRRRGEDPLALLSTREQRVVKGYAAFMVVGSAVAIALYTVYGIPIAVSTVTRAVQSLTSGIEHGHLGDALDGSLTLAVELAFQGLFIYAWLRGRRERIARLRERLV